MPSPHNNGVKAHQSHQNVSVPQLQLSYRKAELSTPDGSFRIAKWKVYLWPSFMSYTCTEKLESPNLPCDTAPSKSFCAAPTSTVIEPAAHVKRKWRQNKVTQSFERSISSQGSGCSWRKIKFLWCGWLLKQSSGILGQWQARWFELRQEPVSACGSRGNRAVLQYNGRGSDGVEKLKRLELIDVCRDCGHDGTGRTCLSVRAVGRSGRVLLGSGSDGEAASLLSCISLILRMSSIA